MNEKIKKSIRTADLKQWQVAAEMGITEYTLCRWLRHKLTALQEQRITDAIKVLSQGGVKDE